MELVKVHNMKALQLIIMLLLCIPGLGQHAKTFFEPEFQKVKLGDTFQTRIIFYTGHEPISAFDIHLEFDPEILKVVSIKDLQSDVFTYHRPFKFDNSLGKIDASAYQIDKTVPTDKFAIAEISFLAISPKKTAVKHVLNDFPKTIMAYGGVNMLQIARDLNIEIEGESLGNHSDLNEMELGLEIWPNPSNVSSQVQFKIPYADRVHLGLYDLKGNLISEIYEGEISENIPYLFNINVLDLSSGVYACRLLTNDSYQTEILVVSH